MMYLYIIKLEFLKQSFDLKKSLQKVYESGSRYSNEAETHSSVDMFRSVLYSLKILLIFSASNTTNLDYLKKKQSRKPKAHGNLRAALTG